MGYEQYREVALRTSPADQGIRLLFEGAIRYGQLGAQAIGSGDVEATHNYLRRAQDVVSFLRITLNPEQGDLAQRMDSILLYVWEQLVDANVKKRTEPIDKALDVLGTVLGDLEQVSQRRSPMDQLVGQPSGSMEIIL